jgi:Glycosyl transferase family 2
VALGGRRPRVSVVIPTYRRREHVRCAVASVLTQTYRDFEVIVVDDGSTDGTDSAVAGLDARLRYYRRQNQGVASARNFGIRASRGDVVAFLDSDNRWLENHLTVLTGMLSNHPEAVAASTCPNFQVKGRARVEEAQVVDLLPMLTIGTGVGYMSCVAVHRAALLAVGAFNEELPVWDDSDLFLRLAMRGPFCVLNHQTIVHRTTRGGLRERGIRNREYLTAMERSAEAAEKELIAPERPDVQELLDSVRSKILLVRGLRAAIEGRQEEAKPVLEEACRLRPDLSHRPGLVLGNLRHGIVDGRSLADAIAATARAWPDSSLDTARFLSMCTALLVFRGGRRRDAAAWLVRANLVRHPALLVRTRRQIGRLLREWLEARSDGSEEAVAQTRKGYSKPRWGEDAP